MDLNELLEARKTKESELDSLINTGKSEKRKLDETETKKFNDLKAEIADLDKEINNKNNRKNKNHNIMKETKRLSMLKALNYRLEGRAQPEEYQAMIEAGVRNFGANKYDGLTLPMNYRAVVDSTAGDSIVNVETMNIVDALRDKLVLSQAGAQFMTINGKLDIPSYTGSNVTWEGETDSAQDGAGTFSKKTLDPKRLTAYVAVSKKFLQEATEDMEAFFVNDLSSAIAEKLQSSILGTFSGSTSQPAGVLNGLTEVTGATAYETVLELESQIELNKTNGISYIMNPKAKAVLKNSVKGSSNQLVMTDNKELNGYAAYSTTSLADNLTVFADWTQLVIGSLGAIDFVIDPYTLAADGQIRLVVNFYVDYAKRRNDSFAYATIS